MRNNGCVCGGCGVWAVLPADSGSAQSILTVKKFSYRMMPIARRNGRPAHKKMIFDWSDVNSMVDLGVLLQAYSACYGQAQES